MVYRPDHYVVNETTLQLDTKLRLTDTWDHEAALGNRELEKTLRAAEMATYVAGPLVRL
jgi:hypothetical protein